jgi:nucleotide-binding universal stress UspA family protein
MPNSKEQVTQPYASNNGTNGDKNGQDPKVVVCAKTESSTEKVLPHALAISNALGIELKLVHVLESNETLKVPLDPIDWDLRRREAQAFVNELSKQYESKTKKILTQVLQGGMSDKICTALVDEDIVAICRSNAEQAGQISHTVRQILEKTANTVFIVPVTSSSDTFTNYKQIIIPLDGSARAESVLPLAKKIAQANKAALILIHAIPDSILTEIEPLNNEDIALRDNLTRRNERVARSYLDRMQENISASGIASKCVIVNNGDPRRLLNEAITSESADLLILSSHGQSGHADVATGDVTNYLLANVNVPIMLVRRRNHNGNHNGNNGGNHLYKNVDSKGVRLPTGTE